MSTEKRIGVPRRAVLGTILGTLVMGAMVGLGKIGAIDTPETEHFRFTRGTSFAMGEEQRLRGYINQTAAEDRIVYRITGHTGTMGDEQANQDLSDDRAKVTRAILISLGVPPSRIVWAGGVGGGNPLNRNVDENERAFESRLARVEINTVVDQ